MTAGDSPSRLVVLASHPIQYQAPLFRALAERVDSLVLFAHRATPGDQASAGFGKEFIWDLDLLSGYHSEFLDNVSVRPGLDHFGGCDTPEIGRRLAEFAPDALLIMGWHLKSYRQGMRAAKRSCIPVMVRGDSQLATPRSLAKRLVKRFVFPYFLRRFDAALYVGQKSREYWRHYHYPQQRMFFSPHCIDNHFFRAGRRQFDKFRAREQLGIPCESDVVLFVGKLVPFKRPLDLVEAAGLARYGAPNLCIAFAGSGALEESIRERAKVLDVDCHLLGFRNQSELPLVYAAADALVLPSEGAETWGLVANEALACGVPVILSDQCGSAPDLAADGVAGRVYPTGNLEALARAICEILRNSPESSEISLRADAYSVEAAVAGIMEALEFLRVNRSGGEGAPA